MLYFGLSFIYFSSEEKLMENNLLFEKILLFDSNELSFCFIGVVNLLLELSNELNWICLFKFMLFDDIF